MKFERFIVLLVAVGLLFGMSACSKVPAGHVGVKVYLLGGKKGVESEQLGVGRYWIGWNEELYLFPTFTQNKVWTKEATEDSPTDESITFQDKDGMSLNADIGISYAVRPEKVADVFQKYRKQLSEITDVYLRNMVRDAFVEVSSKLPVDQIYGEGKSAVVTSVEARVREQVGDMFVIERIYLVGDLRLPPQVTQALNEKIKATQTAQQKENEIRSAKADAEKVIAAAKGEADSLMLVAKAQAEANKIIAASITSELVAYKSLEKWNGVLPATMIPGGTVPFVPIK